MIRSWMNKNSTAVSAGAVLLIVVALLVLVARLRSDEPLERTPMAWFYDLNDQKLFAAAAYLTPPIQAPSGPDAQGNPAGVRAHVFSCGDCGTSKTFIAYIEKPGDPPPNSVGAGEEPVATEADMYAMIRRPQDAEWVRDDSPQGQAIIAQAQSRCGPNKRPNYCRPQGSTVRPAGQ